MKMKSRIKAFAMAIVMLFATILPVLSDLTPVYADEGVVLKIHYHREDNDYSSWDVWLWEEGKEGAGYAFEEVDGEMVATMQTTPGTTSVGFIVRTEDWSKDVDADQFIDISEMVSGTAHIYIESGVEGYTKEYGDDAVKGTKLKNAKYNNDGTISVTMTGELDGDLNSVFAVAGKAGNIDITDVTHEGNNVYLAVLAEELDNAKSYTITYAETEYPIIMPVIYSTAEFEEAYTYTGDDLGANWSKESTTFRVWAPTAEEAYVNLYESGTQTSDNPYEILAMEPDVNGTWVAQKSGDLNGVYYTYSVVIDGKTSEACDPYARTCGVNGKRAMVIDLDSTDPEGWENDKNPHAGEGINDAVIYELQIRDFATSKESGIENVGKYLAFTEKGTTTSSGISTGVDHLVDLGVTHIHIMPFYDFGSVNETYTYNNLYNWGYDPVNYNVPEGSYSTDPYNGEVRVKEAKQMVQALHENGLSVVMDVVYNHVYSAQDFCINKLVPGYFSRVNADGTYSNGSGCGNDTATERSMVKKYIVDSVNYWADEYHIDGFRFDLVGLIDVETINEIVETVHETHPDVIFYGEGWTMNTNVTKAGYKLATQTNSGKTPGFAYFNDTIRDGLKGNVFNTGEVGFVSGAGNQEQTMISSFMADVSWCDSPAQTINYAACHDNLTLFDRLAVSRPDASKEDLIRMNNLAASVYMLSEGVPFIMAGEELLRSKPNGDGTFNSNSYASGDEINSILYESLDDAATMQVYEYYKGLIAFRKAHAALRLSTAEEVAAAVVPLEGLEDNVVGFDISGAVEGETADELFVVFNANNEETQITLPDGTWNVYINGEKAGTEILETITNGTVTVEPISAMVFVRESKGNTASADNSNGAVPSDAQRSDMSAGKIALIVAVVLAGIALAGYFGFKARKKNSKNE